MSQVRVPPRFEVTARDGETHGRCGVLRLAHGEVETPVFMPVGTCGTIKTLTWEDVEDLGYRLVLANTYHLYLRPGAEAIERMGHLRGFTGWNGAFLTDSGGYQVFSLADRLKIREEGVEFSSHLDGTRIVLTPEESIRMQAALDPDIVMAFDECVRYPAPLDYVREATDRSYRWTERSHRAFQETMGGPNQFFGIVQGGVVPELRLRSAELIRTLDCDGHAVGGLSVGEPMEEAWKVLELLHEALPADRPRYLMGVGRPRDILEAVSRGIDMFDCVLPTRMARHGHLYTSEGRLNLMNACHRHDTRPPDESCRCRTCSRYSRAYLHHLFRAKEGTAQRLASVHNLHHYASLMQEIRQAVKTGTLMDLKRRWPGDERKRDRLSS